MKFSCNRSDLIKEISIAQEIIASHNTISILSNVLLVAEDESLTLKATDIKISFISKIPVEVEQSGIAAVYCSKFLEVLRILPECDLTITLKSNGTIRINPHDHDMGFSLKIQNGNNFPQIEMAPGEEYFSFSRRSLIKMIKHTVFAVSTDETRYFMNGVYLSPNRDRNEVTMAATDGLRLSIITKKSGSPIPFFDPIIIPKKILNCFKRIESPEGDLKMAVVNKQLFLKFGGRMLSTALIDGNFPDFQRLLPLENPEKLIINKSKLSAAVKRMSVLVHRRDRTLRMKINTQKVELITDSSELGDGRESIPCEFNGESKEIIVNYHFLGEPLKKLDGDTAVLSFKDEKKAFSIESAADTDYLHIIMPIVKS